MRHSGLDALRILSLLGVVVIHVNAQRMFGPDAAVGHALDEAARFAVPCFFILSGFFWKPERIADASAQSNRILKRVGLLFLVWTALYWLAEFSGLYPREFHPDALDYTALLLVGGAGYHLWFLPALIVGSVISWQLLQSAGLRNALVIAFVLYALGVSIGAYGPLLGFKLQVYVFRNGLFEAPLLLLAGYAMQSERSYVDRRYFLLAILAGLAIHYVEGSVTGDFPRGHDFSFGTLPFAIGMLGLFRTYSLPVGNWGKDVLGGYLVHLFVLKLVIAHTSVTGTAAAIATAFAVTLISLLVSRGFKWREPMRFLVAS